MKTKEKKIEDELNLLKFIGFMIPSLTILVSTLKFSTHTCILYFVLISGMQLSWKFHLKGLAISIAAITLFALYNLIDQNFNQWFWTIGLSSSMILSLIIVFLTEDESKGLILNIKSESESRLNNLIQLDEKQQKIAQNYQLEKDQFTHKMQIIEDELLKSKEKIESSYQLNVILKKELEFHIHQENECKNEIKQFSEKNIFLEKSLLNKDEELKKQKEHVITLESLLEYSEEEKILYEKNFLIQKDELDQLKLNISKENEFLIASQEEIKNLKDKLNDIENYRTMEKVKFETLSNETEEKLLVYEKLLEESALEKKKLQEEIKKSKSKTTKKSSGQNPEMEKKFNNLQNEFNEKSLELEDTRRALFRMQEKLLTIQRENEETRRKEKNELKATFEEIIEKNKIEKNAFINS